MRAKQTRFCIIFLLCFKYCPFNNIHKKNNLGLSPNLIKTPTEVHYATFFGLNKQVMCLTGCLSPLTSVTSLTPEVTWPWGDTWSHCTLLNNSLYITIWLKEYVYAFVRQTWKIFQ